MNHRGKKKAYGALPLSNELMTSDGFKVRQSLPLVIYQKMNPPANKKTVLNP